MNPSNSQDFFEQRIMVICRVITFNFVFDKKKEFSMLSLTVLYENKQI